MWPNFFSSLTQVSLNFHSNMAPKAKTRAAKVEKVAGDSKACVEARAFLADTGCTADSMMQLPQPLRSACFGALAYFNKKNPQHELSAMASEVDGSLPPKTLLGTCPPKGLLSG